jgi:excisionase family DNA binding protein
MTTSALSEARLPTKILVTLDQAATLLSMSRDHLDRHVRRELPIVRSGGLKLVRVEDLRRWAEKHAELTLPERR